MRPARNTTRVPVATVCAAAALFTTVLLLGAAPARAEDEPAFTPPGFTVEQIASSGDEHPEGWTPMVTGGALPTSAPTAGRLLALAKAAGLDTQTFNARSRPFIGADKASGVVAVMGIDTPVAALTAPLAAAAAENGWTLRKLGTPQRMVVVWGSTEAAAKALMQWQVSLALNKLLDLAFTQRQNALRQDDRAAFQTAVALLEEVAAIAPDAGAFHAIKGIFLHQQGTERAFPHFRKALDEKTPLPARLKWKVFIAGELGMGLLLNGSEDGLEEAARVLGFAVENEAETKQALARFGNRYNLACAYARLGNKDKAFTALEGSLKFAQAELGEQYASHFAHCKDTDTDMASLREDERFDALMEKYAPEGAK